MVLFIKQLGLLNVGLSQLLGLICTPLIPLIDSIAVFEPLVVILVDLSLACLEPKPLLVGEVTDLVVPKCVDRVLMADLVRNFILIHLELNKI